MRFLAPVPELQMPVPEVGLLSFAGKMLDAIRPEERTIVLGAFSDTYVEPNSLNMALGMKAQPQNIRVRGIRPEPKALDVSQWCTNQWFITKTKRPHSGQNANGMWVPMNSLHALITDPASPLHGCFRQAAHGPIQQHDISDTLVLWDLPAAPPKGMIVEALVWLKPRLSNDPAAFVEAVEEQMEALSGGVEGESLGRSSSK